MGRPPRCVVDFDPVRDIEIEALDRSYAQLRIEQPIFHWEKMDSWVVTRHDDVAEVFREPDRFPAAAKFDSMNPDAVELLRNAPSPWGTKMLGVDEGADHDRIRKTVSGWFVARRVRHLEPLVREIVREVLEGFRDEKAGDLITGFSYLVPINVILAMLGFPREDQERQKAWSDMYLRLLTQPMDAAEQRRHAEGIIEFQEYILEIIRRRQREPQDDAFGQLALAQARGEAPISVAELIQMVFTLIFAGHETTTYAASNMVRHLLEVRARWEAVASGRWDARAVVEEAVRFDGPSRVTTRFLQEPAALRGVEMRGRVILALFSANRDEMHFTRPGDFDPERSDRTPHFGFGYGNHYCLGASLARLELRVMLEELQSNLPALRLAPDEALAYKPNASVAHLRTLPVVW